MDQVLADLKQIREEVEARLNGVLEECEILLQQQAAELAEDEDSVGKSPRRAHDQLAKIIAAIRDVVALNNARSAELARQLSILPAKRFDLMIETLEKRIETLEADIRREKCAHEKP